MDLPKSSGIKSSLAWCWAKVRYFVLSFLSCAAAVQLGGMAGAPEVVAAATAMTIVANPRAIIV